MARKNFVTLLGVVLLIAMMAALQGCTFRDGPAWDPANRWNDKDKKAEHEEMMAAHKQEHESLEKRVSELERRADETYALAEQANATAEKALKCCRKDYTVVMTEEIYFDFNKFDVRDQDKAVLDRVAEKLKSDQDLIAELQGHTDGVGNVDYNIVLGQKRADAARMYLIDRHNIAMGRLAIRTFGKDAPIASNDSEQGRSKNRRVTIDVLGFAP